MLWSLVSAIIADFRQKGFKKKNNFMVIFLHSLAVFELKSQFLRHIWQKYFKIGSRTFFVYVSFLQDNQSRTVPSLRSPKFTPKVKIGSRVLSKGYRIQKNSILFDITILFNFWYFDTVLLLIRVARWFVLKPKIPIWVNLGGP
jgi:hypothetical protein